MQTHLKKPAFILSTLLLGSICLDAAITVYTNKAAFDSAISTSGGAAAVVDFDNFADNTVIAPLPRTLGGITFESFSTPGYDLIVDSEFGGTSGSNYLRVTDDGGASTAQFGFDDTIGLSFSQPSNAIGLYIIVSSTTFDFFPNDINITVNGNTYSNNGSETATTVNGAAALFFGVVDNSASFNTASIAMGDIGTSIGDYDDISYSVIPEPGFLGLAMGAAAWGALLLRRRRSR